MREKIESLLASGDFLKLKTACETLLKTESEGPLIRHVLGLLLLWSGEFEGAESLISPQITQAIRLQDTSLDVDTLVSEASKLRSEGKSSAAVFFLIKGLLGAPLHPGAISEMAESLGAEGRHIEAAGFFRTLSRLQPDNVDAVYRWGTSLLCASAPALAAPVLHKATTMKPTWHLPWRCLAMALLQDSQHVAATQALRVCMQLAPNDSVSLSQQIFSLHYCPESLQRELPGAYRAYAERFCPPTPPTPLRLEKGERIRIGYVSGDFKHHPVAFFFEPLLAHHDTQSFETFAYSNLQKRDSTTERLQSLSQNWRETVGLSNDAFVEMVRRDGIHVLVDLSGHTPMNRLLAFAKRPAPIQITMIGAMMSTGVPAIDYRITDSFLDPEGTMGYGTECPLRMRMGPVVFLPPAYAPDVAEAPVLAGHPFTFASLNDPAKVTDETLSVWAEILLKAPDSRLCFVRRKGNLMKKRLENLGVPEGRLIEKDYRPLPQFLKMLEEVDLALDPFPYNGLTVTLQSCWMGVPPLTLMGSTPPSRAAAMVLSKMGLPEFITYSKEEYVNRAVAFALDPSPLAKLRRTLRELTFVTWCNAEAYAREFEDKIRMTVAKHLGVAES